MWENSVKKIRLHGLLNLARAKGIKNKSGQLTWKDKNTANYWAVRWLW